MDIYSLIRRHEGLKLCAYKDTKGLLTIGYGRCLQVTGISADEADYMLKNDVTRTMVGLHRRFEWFQKLGDDNLTRQYAIIDMAFNLGIDGVAKFEKMIEAIERQDWEAAAAEMVNSEWRKEVGDRALDDAQLMLTGEWPE